jgi:hypothetical protein
MLLLLLLVWSAQGAELIPDGYVPRLNLGVVFIEETTPLVVGTELLDLTIILPYHIIPPIETLFLEISKADLALSERFGKTFLSKTIFTIKPMSNTTCLSAMWRNDMAYMELCKIMAYPLIPAPDFAWNSHV